jgi:hypothetical protein
MRSIVVILVMLSVVGILLTPSFEDEVAGTLPSSMATCRGRAMTVESSVKHLKYSSVISLVSTSSAAQPSVSVMRC